MAKGMLAASPLSRFLTMPWKPASARKQAGLTTDSHESDVVLSHELSRGKTWRLAGRREMPTRTNAGWPQ